MKKLLLLLLIFILCGCANREDYFIFSYDNYSIAPGYDNVEYLSIAYDFDRPDTIGVTETIDTDLYQFGKYVGFVQISNSSKKDIEINKAILSSAKIYLNDLGNRVFKINDYVLDKSIKKNCDSMSGQYIEKNGYACLIEKEVNHKNNYIIMYGDYLNIDQDTLDHIEIGVK